MQKTVVGSMKVECFGQTNRHVSKTLTKEVHVGETTIKRLRKIARYTKIALKGSLNY